MEFIAIKDKIKIYFQAEDFTAAWEWVKKNLDSSYSVIRRDYT